MGILNKFGCAIAVSSIVGLISVLLNLEETTVNQLVAILLSFAFSLVYIVLYLVKREMKK